MSDLMLDVDQAGELKAAFRRGNWTNQEIKRLCEGDTLAQVRDVLLARAEIKPAEHLIDCDADPFCPDGWKVEEHKKSGKIKWTKELIKLYLSANQKKGRCIQGNELRKELASKSVMNACVLDFLLAHPELIPEEWKGKCVFFWGTVYSDSDGGLYVRGLYWYGARWHWYYYWLGRSFHGSSPAACSQVSS